VGAYRRGVVGLLDGHRYPVGAGHVPGLELLVDGGVDLQVTEAGQGRQVKGVRGVEDGAALLLGEGAQPQPVGEVGVQPTQFAALDALAGQQQVDTDAAADAADGQEQLDEVGPGGQQFTELVDDHEQVRQRGQVRVVLTLVLVVGDVGNVAGVAQHLLAALYLTGQAGVDAFDECGVVL